MPDLLLTNKTNFMKISFNELRAIKHRLPTGSIKKIAEELQLDEQTVRNYFGASKYVVNDSVIFRHIEPGPDGGIVHLERLDILECAKNMMNSVKKEKTMA